MDDQKTGNALPSTRGPVEGEDLAVEVAKSLGERLIPLLVTVMECCLISSLLLVMAGFIPGASDPLLPIWAVFLIFLGFYGLVAALDWFIDEYLEHLPASVCRALVGLALGGGVLVGLVFCTWLHFYAQDFALFDAAWLQALTQASGQLDGDLQIVVLAFFLCVLAWLSFQTVQGKTNVALLLSKGTPLMLILAAVNLAEGLLRSSTNFWQIVLLLSLFYWLGLTAQALQKASKKRKQHASAPEENPRRQERIIFQSILLLGLSMIIMVLGTLLTYGDITLYIPRVNPFAPLPVNSSNPVPSKLVKPPEPLPISPTAPGKVLPIWLIIGLVMLVLLSAVLVCLFWRLWAKRKKRQHRKAADDEHKSLWNWALFWSQCIALVLALLALFKRLLRKSGGKEEEKQGDFWQAPPEIRSVRELYQAFLQKATRQGYPRQHGETPQELRQRLNAREALLEPELETITDAYTLVRYGGCIPREDEIEGVKAAWHVLDSKWHEAGSSGRVDG